MDVNQWVTDVLPDGSIIDPDGEILGQLSVLPKIVRSPDDGGCGGEDCKVLVNLYSLVIFGF